MKEGEKVYKYYLGNHCNIYTKREEEPTIICASDDVIELIDRWVDKYLIDYDRLIETIISAIHIEIEKIDEEYKNNLVIHLSSGEIAFLELYNEDEPKIRLNYNENEYDFCLRERSELVSCSEIDGQFHFGVEADKNEIYIGKKETLIVIKPVVFDEKLYNALKSRINELENWENIYTIMCWLYKLPVEITDYELSICSRDEEDIGLINIVARNCLILTYTHVNQFGTYQVECDGSWKAEHKKIKFLFDIKDKICRVFLPKSIVAESEEYKTSLNNVKELIGTMYATLKVINYSIEKMI